MDGWIYLYDIHNNEQEGVPVSVWYTTYTS